MRHVTYERIGTFVDELGDIQMGHVTIDVVVQAISELCHERRWIVRMSPVAHE